MIKEMKRIKSEVATHDRGGYTVPKRTLFRWIVYLITTIESKPKMWDCPDCAFSFDAIHVDEPGGGYSCPVCAESRLEKLLEEKDALIDSQKVKIEKAQLQKREWHSKAIELASERDKYWQELKNERERPSKLQTMSRSIESLSCIRDE
jgi:hypothetical protein